MADVQGTYFAKPVSRDLKWRAKASGDFFQVGGTLSRPPQDGRRHAFSVDVVSGTTPQKAPIRVSETVEPPVRVEDELVSLSPLERWIYLYRKRKTQFILLVLSALAWVFACLSLFSSLTLYVDNFLIRKAEAATSGPDVSSSSSFFMEPSNFFMVILSLFVIWALGTITFSRTSEKVGLAADTLKVLLGLVVGYFSSLKAR